MADPVIPFGPDDDNRVPGEVLVKITGDEARNVTESIPSGPIPPLALSAGADALPRKTGIDSVDKVLGDVGVQAITKVHGPVPSAALSDSQSGARAADLGATYRIRTGSDADAGKLVGRFERLKAVEAASPNYYRFALATTPNDSMFGLQWGLAKINCPDAWDRTKGSSSVKVAVIDSGVDLDHPELQPLLLPGRDLVDLVGVAPKPGWHFEGDFLTRDNTPQDEVGHGTHVAGTIAAVSDNGTGVAGVTWHCRLLPVKVLTRMVRNSDGAVTGVGTAVDIAAGIRWAADNGAHILNLSLGGYNDTFVERDAVAYAVSKGCLVVAAMGNDNVSTPSYPAAYPDVVAVGAVNQSESRAAPANTGGWGSNTGSHIDVMGPGVGIRSTDWDNTYSNKSGTSMATPHVSGVAALVKSCKMSLTAAQIADTLRNTAKTLKDDASDPVPNDRYGHGLVDAKAALGSACPTFKLKFLDEPGTVNKFFDDGGGKLKFVDDPRTPFKIVDDGLTLKFPDDGGTPNKFVDDPKTKFQDDPPTFKFTEDVKTPGLDKNPGSDRKLPGLDGGPGLPGRPGFKPPRFGREFGAGQGASPFVLATPHHSTAYLGGDPDEVRAQLEEAIDQVGQQLAMLQEASQHGGFGPAEQEQARALQAQYGQLVQQYQMMFSGLG
jgi:subtilisin family serine protease